MRDPSPARPETSDDTDAALERLLRARATTLAERVLDTPSIEVWGTVIVTRRLGALLGFPIETVREVRRVRVNRLPHAKDTIGGLFQLRGVLHVLVDPTPIAGRGSPLAHGEMAIAVVLEREGRCLGVRVDEVIGPELILAHDLDRAHGDRQIDLVAEVTRGCVEIVSVEALFQSPQFQMGQKS